MSRRALRVAPLLLLSLLLGCGTDRRGLVLFAVDAVPALSGVTTLTVTVTQQLRTATVEIPLAGAPVEIPPKRTFGLRFPVDDSGTYAVTVTARDAGGLVLATGSTSVTLGTDSAVLVTLGNNAQPDMAGDAAGDGASFDLPADLGGDAGPVDLIKPFDLTDLAPVADLTSTTTPVWKWSNPLPQGNALTAVWGSSPSDVYAVGRVGTILHSTNGGTTWVVEPSGTTRDLNAVWGRGATDVFAVGINGTIVHKTTGGWVAQGGPTGFDLAGVSGGAMNTFAVGSGSKIVRSVNGGAWQSQTCPLTTNLAAVWAASDTDVWAVGTSGAIIHTTDGMTWNSVTTAQPTTSVLHAVWGAGVDRYVVGDNTTIFHSTDSGASFLSEGVSMDMGTGNFTALWGADKDRVIATSSAGPVLATFNRGAAWTFHSTVAAQPLLGLWGSAINDIYAVGSNGMIEHSTDGTSWSLQNGPFFTPMHGVWGSSATDVWAVGDAGLVAHSTDGASWTISDTTAGVDLLGAWGSGASNVVAVGRIGKVAQFNGNTWTVRTTPTTSDLFDVWGSSATDVYAVGDAGALMRSTNGGTSWTKLMMTGPTVRLNGVWGDGARVYVVGASDGTRGTIQYSDNQGTDWTAATSGAIPNSEMLGVGGSGGDLFVAGAGGLLLHSKDGGQTFLVRMSGGSNLNRVTAFADGNVFAVGGGGALFHSVDTGLSFGAVTLARNTLNAAWGSRSDDVHVVGQGGAILRFH